MSTIATLNDGITGASFRGQVNTNFSNLNTDKLESTNLKTVNGNSLVGSGDIVISGGGSVATDSIWDAKGDLVGGTGANTASRLAVGTNGQVLVADSTQATGMKWANASGTGDMMASTYDPTNIAGDAFARANHTGTQNFTTIVGNEITGNTTASNGGVYIVTASATFADPSPSQGLGYKVIVRNGTATIGGTGYSVAGSEIIRLYHSGAWANYLKTPSSGVNTGDQTTIVGITGTKSQFDAAVTDGNIVYSGDSPTLATITTTGNIELGDASDTTISRVSAGKIAVEGVNVGNEGILQNSQSAAYTLVLADAGKHIYHPSADTTARTWTIPANSSVAFPIGTAVTFINDTSAGTLTISITTDTLVLAGAGTTGSRTLTANGIATAVKVTSTRWIISGTNLT